MTSTYTQIQCNIRCKIVDVYVTFKRSWRRVQVWRLTWPTHMLTPIP